jgi:hypothetical protein
MRTVVVVVVALVVGCGGGKAEPERAPLEPRPEPVEIELAWVVAAAPTEVKEVEAKLVLRVVRAAKGQQMHELGAWWRAQSAVIELVEPTSAEGPLFFRTEAVFGADGDLTKGPRFEVLREAGGAVIARGRDEDTPWRQLERLDIPAQTPVEARRPPAQ